MKENYKDVTGIEFQGCFGDDTCKGIEKSGKYIIRVIDNTFGEKKADKDPILGEVSRKLDNYIGVPIVNGSKKHKEYEALMAEYRKLMDIRFGKDSDYWKPVNVEVIKAFNNNKGTCIIQCAPKKWYYYNGNHRCFKPCNFREAKELIDCMELS